MSRYIFCLLLLIGSVQADPDLSSVHPESGLLSRWKALNDNEKAQVAEALRLYQNQRLGGKQNEYKMQGALQAKNLWPFRFEIQKDEKSVEALVAAWREQNRKQAVSALDTNIAASRENIQRSIEERQVRERLFAYTKELETLENKRDPESLKRSYQLSRYIEELAIRQTELIAARS